MIKKPNEVRPRKEAAAGADELRPMADTLPEPESGGSPPVVDTRLASARESVKSLTNDFQLFCRSVQNDEQIELLGRMQQHIKTLRSAFSIAALAEWAQFTSAVSTFLFATAQKPGFPSFSAFRTMADAMDLLRTTVISGTAPYRNSAGLGALVFDEEAAGRQALLLALQGQGIAVTECDSAEKTALVLREQAFDVILFDTTASGTDEFSFSTELRRLPQHQATPVILVTPLKEFEIRSASLLSARCDFIAKPIVPSEAAVKAFTFGLAHRRDSARAMATRTKTNGGSEPAGAGAPPAAEAAPPPPPPAPPVPDERRLAAERAAEQLAQDYARAQQELAARTAQLEQTQAEAATLEKTRQSLALELGKFSRREEQIKQQCAVLEQQLETLGGTLSQTRRELAQENKRRLAAEQESGRLARQLQELARAETAARCQLDKSAREHAEELARSASALEKAAAARQEVERTCADLCAVQARMVKQLSEGRLQALQAREATASLDQAQKMLQAELRDVLERQTLLDEHYGTLDHQLHTLAETLKPA